MYSKFKRTKKKKKWMADEAESFLCVEGLGMGIICHTHPRRILMQFSCPQGRMCGSPTPSVGDISLGIVLTLS